ncbi:glycoside hydrolase family 18 protein [Aspergillus welwitschiae]|uniref:chitinase n=1 Tax=Aspergillus welwitschiae TaxID=1341132 RepID=A0A3F3Q8G4_9EURO|nr:glycoside hydrolase family 18 protein [Aspergillus welwitschiae]RDH35419.1 glycoside hydrolase family 18 protein [Aspergillus welwitschiae]
MSYYFGALALASPFDSQIHPCPQLCAASSASPNHWTSYHSWDRLERCNEAILFNLNVFNEFGAQTSIRACTFESPVNVSHALSECTTGTNTSVSLQLASWNTTTSVEASPSLSLALEAIHNYAINAFSCDSTMETIIFATHGEVLIGVYIGGLIDSVSASRTLSTHISKQLQGPYLQEAVAIQVCGSEYDRAHTLGMIVSTTGDYRLVHTAVQAWAKASCVSEYDHVYASNTTVLERSTSITTPNHSIQPIESRDDACSYVIVASGDSCASLASKCGITAAELSDYNPSSSLCSTLAPGEIICCSEGSKPDLSPQPTSDGLCYSYTVASGDNCALLASKYYITTDEIEDYNTDTWGWMGCRNLQLGSVICLSSGAPPMPAVVSNAECGPQVNGTTRPSNWSDISGLNPCPLNACCDIWGQCGITPEFCTASESTTGAPGTAANNTNGCISNCGTAIVNNDTVVSNGLRVGYFEAYGVNRSCLAMNASQLPSAYSHVHYAFGEITSDFNVDISGSEDQFKAFAALRSFKRILSFGGWSFSTSLGSYPIFRQGVTDANRLTFAQNVVSFVNDYNLDGVDFDWEYPDAPDIPGLPPGSPTDGPNYLSFLQTLRGLLPSNKTISMAAPASYWYLRGFPIANMSEVLDYIVYMTYDLHGQWDYNNSYVNPGCPTGNCLRSHVNLTETEYALAMITKAGVPAHKVAVGIASYGRSFGMVDPSCTGPECLFTGPDSTATPGECTVTAGYISQAELERLNHSSLARRSATTWHDSSSDSDMMTYGDNSWVAYMTQDTKASRIDRYSSYGFGGVVEWALDLTNFVEGVEEAESNLNFTVVEEEFTAALSLSNYDISNFNTYNLSVLYTKLIGFDGCSPAQRTQIYSGWQQSWKIMNYMYKLVKDDDIDFTGLDAIDFLGLAYSNRKLRDNFKEIFMNLATIQPGWLPSWFDWRIAIRCDDPKYQCPCEAASLTIAYTGQKDAKYQVAYINFCPRYFGTHTLDEVMVYADMDNYAERIAGNMMTYYNNQARVWLHELLHIDWVSKAGEYGRNLHISDLKIGYKNEKNEMEWYDTYGPVPCKALGRVSGVPSAYTIQNADSLALYALAKYVWSTLGEYPYLPLAPAAPKKVSIPMYIPEMFTVYPNGTGVADSNTTLDDELKWSPSEGVCAAVDDEDYDADPTVMVTITTWPLETDYPATYLSSWSSWAGLTPTTTAVTTATATPTATWTITIYAEKDCAGDHYIVEGHNQDTTSDKCLVISDLSSTDTTSASCRWYSSGSDTYTSCDESSLTEPLSWQLSGTGAECTAFDNDSCNDNGDEDAYTTSEGCHNYSEKDLDTKTWKALKCGM